VKKIIFQLTVSLSLGISLFLLARKYSSPWEHIPSDTTVAYLSESCPACITFREILPEKNSKMIVLAVNGSKQYSDDLCRAARINWNLGPAWIPDMIACSFLLEDARAFHSSHFSQVPAFSQGGKPISSAEVQDMLK
jgi:hypothetical protein